MSKNVFAALQVDSEDEQEKPSQNASKPTKKELRADDKQKREHYGDQIEKDPHAKTQILDAPKNKGDYASGEKRPYERHSGTGKPAFTNDFKKGGFGHGNVGKQPNINELKDEKLEDVIPGQENKSKPAEVEPKEVIITLEEYVSKSGVNFGYIQPQPQVISKPVHISDTTVKFVQPKIKEDVVYSKKNSKKGDNFGVGNNNPLLIAPVEDSIPKRRHSHNKKQAKNELSERDFPALS